MLALFLAALDDPADQQIFLSFYKKWRGLMYQVAFNILREKYLISAYHLSKENEGSFMKSSMKHFLSVVLVVMFCVCMTVTAYAVNARYVNDIETMCILDISGGTATLYSEIGGNAAITKAVMTHTLQKRVAAATATCLENRSDTLFTITIPPL